jgi:hypothetical protein
MMKFMAYMDLMFRRNKLPNNACSNYLESKEQRAAQQRMKRTAGP